MIVSTVRSMWTPMSIGALLVLAACGGGGGEAATPTTAAAVATTVAAPVATAPTATAAPVAAARSPGTDELDRAECVVVVAAGDSLGAIAARVGDDAVTVESIQLENRLGADDVIHPDDELDVCIGNDVDDVTGASRLPPDEARVEEQQRKLNELFAPFAIAELEVDGISGPLTRQMLCAARMGLGLRPSTDHMAEDSPEEAELFAATALSIPNGAATWASKWILIDKTCQVVFTGEGESRLVEVFPTSTGEPGFETRNAQALPAYRFDPASDNNGWHDSSRFPSPVDEPLNGNMYKPLYFNRGQAIHGANYVPPNPRSKGCARLFPWHHDWLLEWLGLDGRSEVTWQASDIGAVVTVQGDFRGD